MKNFKITFLNETINKRLEIQQKEWSLNERLNTNKAKHDIETFGFRRIRH